MTESPLQPQSSPEGVGKMRGGQCLEVLSDSLWRAESRKGLHLEPEEAFLREVALGLVEAEKKRERRPKSLHRPWKNRNQQPLFSLRLGLLIPQALRNRCLLRPPCILALGPGK